MGEEKVYQFNEYVLGYDKGKTDRSVLTISKVLNGNMYVMATLTDGSADVISLMLDNLIKKLQKKENIIKEVREKINRYEFISGYYDACYDEVYDTYSDDNLQKDMLKILDKENKDE